MNVLMFVGDIISKLNPWISLFYPPKKEFRINPVKWKQRFVCFYIFPSLELKTFWGGQTAYCCCLFMATNILQLKDWNAFFSCHLLTTLYTCNVAKVKSFNNPNGNHLVPRKQPSNLSTCSPMVMVYLKQKSMKEVLFFVLQ